MNNMAHKAQKDLKRRYGSSEGWSDYRGSRMKMFAVKNIRVNKYKVLMLKSKIQLIIPITFFFYNSVLKY